MTQYASALVNVPQPSGKITITENATGLDIEQYAEADINVQPNLQTPEPITPTKQQQTLTPDAGYDGLTRAVVEPIPAEYIVPSGKVTLTENATDVDVSQYETADIAVPVPVMPEEYATGGSIADNTATGYYIKRATTTIVFNAFRYHTNLESIDIPNSVTAINDQAFNGCSKLVINNLPNQLASLGQGAFYGCKALVLPDGLPSTLTSISGTAFQQCTSLNFDYLPNNLTVLNKQTFAQCSSLALKKLPSNLTSIGDACFSGCIKLLIDEIPATVTLVDKNAFYYCQSVTSITFKGTPTTINASAFAANNQLLNIYVPWSEGEVANAPWGAANATIHYNYTGGD